MESLASMLFGDVRAANRRAAPGGIEERLRVARIADYRNGNLVVLDGWCITRTEARLLALLALQDA